MLYALGLQINKLGAIEKLCSGVGLIEIKTYGTTKTI